MNILAFFGPANFVLNGNTGADTLRGSFGDDVLRGGAGADKLIGGSGLDTAAYEFSSVGVTVNLSTGTASGGDAAGDRLSSIEYIVGSSYADTLTGNDLGNFIDGGAGFDRIDGGGGNDAIFGRDGGGVLRGGAGNDRIDGGAQNDTIYGGTGDDELRVDQGENSAYGEDGVDTLLGGSGKDSLYGGADADKLYGGDGDDILNGGTGADIMTNDSGAAKFYVDNAVDYASDSTADDGDTVFASLSYTLDAGSYIENFRTTNDAGTGSINLTGNTLAQAIAGNAGANVLNGGGGIDRMAGYGGNDTYIVDSADDLVFENAGKGNDTIMASASYTLRSGVSVEELRTTSDAGTGAIDLRGNEIANKIAGNAGTNLLSGFAGNDTMAGYGGADRLIGGIGADTLYGGTGNDTFVFDATAESGITSTTRDRIVDYAKGDLIDVSDIDARTGSSFAGNQAFVLDTNTSFSIGEIRQTVVDGDLLLEFNTDADSAAEMSILLVTQGPLVSADFVL